jgi:hypothetical protein
MQVRRYIALGSTLLSLCASARASAQSLEELERARGQFQEALTLEVAGDYRTALAKLQQVSKVRLTPQVRYHLARCKEYLGRLTEALGDYRVAATEARSLGLAEIAEFERARAALEAKVPKLLLHVSGSTGKTAVELDGVRLGPSVLDSPIPVDPGLRKISVFDGDYLVSSLEINAVEGQTLNVNVEAKGLPLPGPSNEKGAVVNPRSEPPRSWAYVSAGLGGVALAASAVLFAIRADAIDDLDRACTGGWCPEKMRTTADRGRLASWAAPVTLGVGVAALGAAAWEFWGRDRKSAESQGRTSRARVYVQAGRSTMGLGFSSEF